MNSEELKIMLTERLVELNALKSKIGVTYSRSSELALDWINGLIKINEKYLGKL